MPAPMDVDGPPMPDLERFLTAAAEFGAVPGVPSDPSTQAFVSQFPLPSVFRLLQTEADNPQVMNAACTALERVFQSRWGATLLPQLMPAAAAGLQAGAPRVRQLACSQVARALEQHGADALRNAELAGPLLEALGDSDSGVAARAASAIKTLAATPQGLELLFQEARGGERLKQLASSANATVRVRAMQLAAELSGTSAEAAQCVRASGVLEDTVQELEDTSDVLLCVNALELLGQLATSAHGASFAAQAALPERLASIIRDPNADQLVRSRAMAVAGQLLALHGGVATPLSPQESAALVGAIDEHLEGAATPPEDGAPHLSPLEEEAAIDALGQIGQEAPGAELLLQGTPPLARHVVTAAFRRSRQLAAVHALATIAGAERAEPSPLLSGPAEEALKEVVYFIAAKRSTRTPGGAVWALLQEAEEVRVAAYRLIVPLVSRPWGLVEVTSNADLVNYLCDPRSERSKPAMEWRHAACAAAFSAAQALAAQQTVSIPSEVINKLDAAVKRGPFLRGEHVTAVPIVALDERPPQPPPPPPPSGGS